ncbi:hypothetical protein IJJ05_00250 [Candidatus Saccharibacteria bacterium]|nr:hypothetical protein [Candidatus Saccharibacteria bacterium]
MKKGFTLIELSLSIVFISILSIIIVLLINNSIASYRRGLTLNQINTVGMDLVDDIRTVVQSSPAGAVVGMCEELENEDAKEGCKTDGGRKFVSVVKKNNGVPLFGAFCSGTYSYLWNSGYFFNDEYREIVGDQNYIKEITYNDNKTLPLDYKFKLLKVKDPKRAVCQNAINGNDYDSNISDFESGKINLGQINNEITSNDLEELIPSSNSNLAIYDFSAMAPAVNASGNVSFYSMSFILGTVQGGVNVMASGNFCKAPAETNENFNYCAINKFNFAAQAIGKG